MKKFYYPLKSLVFVTLLLVLVNNLFGQTIAQRGTPTSAFVAIAANSTSLTITKPTGVVAGDLLIANITQVNNSTAPTAPLGWVLVDQRGYNGGSSTLRYGSVFYKVAVGGEPANYTFTIPNGVNVLGAIVAFSNVDVTGGFLVGGGAGGPFDVAPGIILASTASPMNATALTTNNANAGIVLLGEAAGTAPTWSAWTTTSPGALTELYDVQGTGTSVGCAFLIKPTAGSTGPANATAVLTGSERSGGLLLALKRLPSTPTITSLGSASGCPGTSITINGTNFTGATAANVKIGGTPVASITSNSGTVIVAVIGTGTTGTVSVTTASGTGTSAATFTVNSIAGLTYSTPGPVTYCNGVAITNNNPSLATGAATGYSVSPALPAGLGIDPVTGVISGTPTVNAAATNYTVTATNGSCTTTATINITTIASVAALSYSIPGPVNYCTGTAIASNTPSLTGGGTITYSISPALPAGLSISPTTGIISGTPTAATASNTYTITATNGCSSTTATVDFSVEGFTGLSYSTAGPVIYCNGLLITDNNPTLALGTATGFSVSPALPGGLSIDPVTGVISGTPTVNAGATNYVVTATNGSCSTTATINITVIAQITALSYSVPGPINYCTGTTITNNTPSLTGGGTITYSISPALPAGLSISAATGIISGTPTVATASNTYTITATNGCSSNTATVDFSVEGFTGLSYSTAGPVIYCNGVLITDNNPTLATGTPTGYSVSPALPSGLSIDPVTGVISGTPTVNSAAANYVVTTTNGSCSTTATINIAVVAPVTALSYSTPGPVDYCTTVLITTNTATVTGGGTITYSISPALPTGLSISSSTGAITGTPTVATASNTYTITATNGCSSITATVNFAVVPKVATLTYSGGTPVVYCNGLAITAKTPTLGTGTATGYSVSPALPTGLSIDPVTGIISGTPTVNSAAANYTVTATNGNCSTTAVINIAVVAPVTALSYSTPGPINYCTTVLITTNTATVTGGGTITYSISPALPTGLSISSSTGAITGTPTVATASNTYTITATNGCSSITATVNFAVVPKVATLTYSGGTPVVYCNGLAITAKTPTLGTGTATGYSVSPALPTGLSIDPVTGIISGTPTVNSAAANYTVTATNGNCSTTAVINIAVVAPVTALSYSTPGPVNYCTNVAITTNTATVTGGGTITYSISPALPTGLSISSSTGAITGTPTVATASNTYTITATNGCSSITATVNFAVVPKVATLTYSGGTPVVYCNGLAITAKTPTLGTGTATGYSVSPALPTGLSIDPVTGIISGTPTVNSAAANYTVTATNGNCSTTAVINIAVVAPVTALSYSTPGPINYCTTVLITTNTATVTGGGTITYSISPALPTGLSISSSTGAITGTPTVATASNTYTITATNGCSSITATVNFAVVPKVATLTYSGGTPVVFCNGVAITVKTPTLGTGTATGYSVSPALPTGLSIDPVTGIISGTPTVNSAAANYTVTATNGNCSTTAVINIAVVAPVTALSYSTPGPVNYCTSVAITTNTATVTGGGTITYSISPALPTGLSISSSTGAITGTPTTVTAATNYVVTAANTCSSITATINIATIQRVTALTYSSGTPVTYCTGIAITNNNPTLATGAATGYSVSPALPAGLSIDPVTGVISGTPTVSSAASNYVVTATNGSCNTTATINIRVNANVSALSYSVPGPINYCIGVTIASNTPTVVGGGTITYSVSPALPAGLSISPTTGIITGTPTTPTAATDYVVTAANSCSSITATINITANALPVVSFTGSTAICADGFTTLSPTTGGTWLSSNAAVASVDNAGNVTAHTAGSVTFTFTSATTTCSSTTSALTVNALPVIAPITSATSSICVNENAQFNDATGGGVWSIIPGTGNATIDASGFVTGTVAGDVTVVYTFTNATPCTNKVTKALTIRAIPAISPVTGGATAVCVGSSTIAFANATPGGVWSILSAGGTASITTGGVVTGLTPGAVVVLYTTSNGSCTNEATASLTVNPLPVVAAITGGQVSVCVGSTTVPFADATAGGTWSITPGTGTASIDAFGVVTGLTPGNVTVVYTFFNGTCTNTATKALTINALPAVTPITGTATAICINSTFTYGNATPGGVWSITGVTGTASVTPAGVVTGLTAGTVTLVYTVTGTCSANVTKDITINDLPVAGAITGGNIVCAGSSITLASNATGTGSLTYTWASSNNLLATALAGSVTGVAGGIPDITYTVTDGNACSAISPVFPVTVNARPTANITSVNTAFCNTGSNTTTITGTVTANGAWTVTLSSGNTATGNGNGTFSIAETLTATTTYTVTSLTDANCTAIAADLTGSTVVTINEPVAINADPVDQAVCATFPVSFTVDAIGSNLTYQWYKGTAPTGTLVSNTSNITGATTATLHFVQASLANIGDYYVVVTGAAPCTPLTSAGAHLAVAQTITISAQPTAQTVCIGSNVTFSVLASAGGDPLTYQWRKNGTPISGETGSSFTITGTTATDDANYDVVVTGINGCITAFSTIAKLTVNPASVGGTVNASTAVCSGTNSGTLNLTGQTGTVVRWEFSTNAGASWSPLVNTTTSLTYTNLTVTTEYRAVVQSGVCATANSTPATISINPIPDAVATPAAQTSCSGSNINTIVLTSAVPSAIFNWTRNNTASVTGITATGTGDITGALTNATGAPITVTFTITPTAAGCVGAPITATVVVNPTPTATISGTATVCENGTTPNITFTNPMPLAVTITYNINGTGSATVNVAANATATVAAPTNAAGAFAYNLVSVAYQSAPGCSNTISGSATVTVNPTALATISGTTTVCQGSTQPLITFTNPQALPIIVTYNINGVGSATINVGASTTATVAAPTTGAGIFTYNLVSVAYQSVPACSNTISGSATITVNLTPLATISGTTTVCQNGTQPNITFTNPQALPITITYNINGAGSTTIDVGANTTATVAAITTAAGTFNYNLVSVVYQGALACSNTITGTATVTVNPTANASISGTTEVCQSATSPNITFTNPQALAVTITYNINGGANTTVNVGASTTATVGAITTVAGTFTYNLVSVAYQSAPGCSNPISGSAVITVKATPTATISGTTTVCRNGTAPNITFTNPQNSIVVVTYNINGAGSPTITVPANGTATVSQVTTTGGTFVYNLVSVAYQTGSICSSTISGSATVTVESPVMTSPATAIVCDNSTVSIPLTSTVASTYTWIATANNPNVTGESLTTQTTSTLSNTLDNTSAVPAPIGNVGNPGLTPKQNVVYQVIPTSAAGCVGVTQTVTVTVNPSYNISFQDTRGSDINSQTICDGDEIGAGGQNDMDLFSGAFAGSTLVWQYSIGSNSGPWTANPGPHPNYLEHDTLPDPPSIFSGAGSYYFRLLVDGSCVSDILSLVKTSTLTIAGGATNTVCESGSPAAITLTGAAVNGSSSTTPGGSWAITTLSPDNGSSRGTLSSTAFITTASGNIPNVTYTPPANYSGTVTLTLTSNDPDGTGGTCAALTATRTIVITAAPSFTNAATAAICTGSSTNITLTPPTGIVTNYTYTVGAITGGITGATPNAVPGNVINQVLTNPGTTAGTVQYLVSPTLSSANGCSAITNQIVTVTVLPPPVVTLTTASAAICQGSTTTLTAANSGGTLNGSMSATNYTAQPIQTLGVSTISSIITLPAGTITSASSITLTMNINHTQAGDLTATLISPSCGTLAIFSHPGGTNNGNDLAGSYTFNNTSATTFPANTNPVTPQTYKGTFTGMTFPCASAAGDWTLQINDNSSTDGGSLNSWSLAITTNGNYTSVFSGPATIAAPTYSGVGNTSASAIITPPVGLNSYTVVTTDAAGCSNTSAPVAVTVTSTPTLTTAVQAAPVCVGSVAQINLTGLIPNSTSAITYKITSGGSIQTVSGVLATAAGTASFNTLATLTALNNGQTLFITGITSNGCSATSSLSFFLSVNPTPTLTGASQAAAVCPNSSAQINLTGLVANSTSTITYTVGGGAVQTVTGVVATGTTANFSTIPLLAINNGQTLQITSVTITSATPNCPQPFTRNVTLNVNPTPVLSSTLTPTGICSGNIFSYSPTSATAGSTFGWTRATVGGITEAAASGSGAISETLTNTTSLPITVTYVYTTTANGCSNAPGENVVVTVNPAPTINATAAAATACAGTGATINLTGLLPGTTSTIFYSINNVPQPAITNVVADGTGAASFVSGVVTIANNGQIFKITGVLNTSNTPSCILNTNVVLVLSINPSQTLTGATQQAVVCSGTAATIDLAGLVANSVSTVTYTINGGAPQTATGVTASAGGTASFSTIPLTTANNGQTLQITNIDITSNSPTCSQSFTQTVTLNVKPVNTLTGASQAVAVCANAAATINLAGLPANSLNNTVSYSINGVPQTPAIGVNADASGNASFVTGLLSVANNGQTLTVTGIDNGACSTLFTQNVTLAVGTSAVWLGVDNNWFNPANWCGGVPTIASDVVIPNGLINYPLLSGVGFSHNVTIQAAASLVVSGTYTISGTIISTGTFNASNGDLIFNGTTPQTIAGSMFSGNAIKNLTVSNATGITVSAGATNFLNISGDLSFGDLDNVTLTTNDNIVLVSTATSTARVADITNGGTRSGNSFNGKVTVQRYYPALRAWRLATSPLAGTGNIFNSWQNGGNNVVGQGTYVTGTVAGNATNGLDNGPFLNPSLKAGDNLTDVLDTKATLLSNNSGNAANKGYLIFVRGDRNPINTTVPNTNTTTLSSKGNLQTGTQTFTASSSAGAYTLIGNPYASPVDLNKVTLTNLKKRFYVWDPRINLVGGYVVVEDLNNTGTFTFTPSPSPGSPTQYIQSSEAFFIQTDLAAPASIVFDESNKATSAENNLSMFRPMNPSQTQSLRTNLYFLNDDGTTHMADGNLVAFDESYHAGVDLQDALKFTNVNETFGVLSGTTSLAVDRRPLLENSDTVFYKFSRNRQRKYQFIFDVTQLDRDNLAGFVEDKFLHKLLPLDLNSKTTLNFEVTADAASAAADRFRVVFKPSVVYTKLNANVLGSDVGVEWTVADELDIKTYEIERSTDGVHFAKVGTVASSGNSNAAVTYNWVDASPALGLYHYRIRSISNTNVVGHSNLAKVKLNRSTPAIYVFPNPVTENVLQLQMNDMAQGVYGVRLINSLGQAVVTNRISHAAGTSTETIRPDRKLIAGVYELQVTAPDKKITTVKVIVN